MGLGYRAYTYLENAGLSYENSTVSQLIKRLEDDPTPIKGTGKQKLGRRTTSYIRYSLERLAGERKWPGMIIFTK